MRVALVACAALVSCGVGPSGLEPLRAPSREHFALEAGPLLAKRCGDATCHGSALHPFALYAVGRRRLVEADTFVAKPLSDAEVDANYRATLGFIDHPQATQTTLVKKALGRGHSVGAVFSHPSDPECRAVLRWLNGETE